MSHKFIVKKEFYWQQKQIIRKVKWSQKKDVNPNLYISNAGTNELPLKKSNTVIADDITKVVELLKFDLSSLATSAIVPKSLDRTKNFEEKIKEFNKVFVLKNRIKGIPLTSHDKHQP